MKIIKDQKIINHIQELEEVNELNCNLSDMFLYVIGDRNIANKDEIETLAKKHNLDVNDLMLDRLCDIWEIDPENEDNSLIYQTHIASNVFLADENEFKNNPYYKAIKPQLVKYKDYQLTYDHYTPYELFSYDDIEVNDNYTESTKAAYFKNEFKFLVLNYKDITWMSITPNEIKTMEPGLKKAHGDIIVFGIGLGYFAFMASLKPKVKSITIIENDINIINIFKNNLLPLFPNKEKIKIVQQDALEVIKAPLPYDFAFVDLWHSVEDGLDFFLKFKAQEKNNPNVEFSYWLNNSFYALLRRAFITLLSEQLEGLDASNYQKGETTFDKLVNLYYQKTKNIQIKDVSDIDNLLLDNKLLSMLL